MFIQKKIYSLLRQYFQAVVTFLLILLLSFNTLYSQSNLNSTKINQISRSVVQVTSLESTGSGSVLGDTPFIFTNKHVTSGQNLFLISLLKDLNDTAKPSYISELYAYSPVHDFAVLKVIADSEGNPVSEFDLKNDPDWPGNEFPVLQYLDENDRSITRGDAISIFGYPGISENELLYTTGIISSVKYDDFNGRRMPFWYRTTAEMAPGNSGGIAVDEFGRVIGIPTYVRTEYRTGGRLGSILSIQLILELIDSNRLVRVGRQTEAHTVENRNRTQNTGTVANYGRISLTSNQFTDPFNIAMISGGSYPVEDLGSGCKGYVSEKPDLRLYWQKSSGYLKLFFEANSSDDTTMIINLPNSEWICNDDANAYTYNPLIEIFNAKSGAYDIWIGSYHKGDFIDGELTITEFDYPEPD